MPDPKYTIGTLPRNDLEGAVAIYRQAKESGHPLNGDAMRVLVLSFDDSGKALIAELKSWQLLS